MAKTRQGYRTGILNWYTWPISTGPLEGTNNKVRSLNKRACEVRDLDYFRLKIEAMHLAKLQLIR